MKLSNYNVCTKLNDGQYIVYNILTEAMLELDLENYEFFCNCLSNDYLNDKRLSILYSNGFLIDDDYDEIDFVRYANKKYCTLNDALQLTIAPTMSCNCKCTYCFESAHPGIMGEDVISHLISFVKKQYELSGFHKLHVEWFGGEPMLAWNTIRKISTELIDFSDANSIQFSAGIITNGTLLDKDIVSQFVEAKISRVQITIDGDRKTHNNRRPFCTGEGTYDVIIHNLYNLKESGINVDIRVNMDNQNLTSFEYVKTLMKGISDEFNVYPGQVENFNGNNKVENSVLMSSKEFSQYKSEVLLKDTMKKSLPIRFIACQAQKINSFGIDEKGYLYKCWNELGNPEKSFSTVFTYPAKINGKNLVKYVGHDYISNPECSQCKVLPLCMGGCASLRQSEKSLPCIPEKYCLDEFVKGIWARKINGKEGENENHLRSC